MGRPNLDIDWKDQMPRFRLFTSPRYVLAPAGAAVAALLSFGAIAQDGEQLAQMPGRAGRMMAAQGQRIDRCQRLADRLERTDRNLTSEQIRDIVAGRLAQSGMNTLKVGKVRKDGDVVSLDITTTSGSLVITRDISSKTGLPADLVKRCEDARARRASMTNRDGAADTNAQATPDRGPRDGRGMRGRFERGRAMGGGRGSRGRGFGDRGFGLGTFALVGNAGRGRDLNLTTDQTRKLADAAVVMLGNPRLKVGAVKEKDADTMTVDIVTQDNALVVKQEVDRHNGRMKRAS